MLQKGLVSSVTEGPSQHVLNTDFVLFTREKIANMALEKSMEIQKKMNLNLVSIITRMDMMNMSKRPQSHCD